MSCNPGYALAFAQTHSHTPIVFPTGQVIFDAPIPASYLFEEGSILGASFSAYSSTEDQTDGDPFTTASGTQVRQGVAAANFLPLGTKIQAFGTTYVIEDRMNTRFDNSYKIDIWMDSREEALSFGIRHGVVEILEIP